MALKLDAHALVQAMKELAIQLQKTPTRDEFKAQYPSLESSYRSVFGGYAALVQASGLVPCSMSRTPKITNEIFNVNLERHLEVYNNSQKASDSLQLGVNSKPWPKIAILGDLHCPFQDDQVIEGFIEFCRKEQPEYILQCGDSVDFYAHAKFPKSMNLYTPKQEEELARNRLVKMWADLKVATPKAKLIALLGNHCIRGLKRVLEAVPSIEAWAQKYMEAFFSFDGVQTIMDPREEYIIGDIVFIHGYRSNLGGHRDYMLMNACVGHTHRPGVVYRNIQGKLLWEMNVGYAADPHSKGLSYTSQKMTDWGLGWGWITEKGPMFVPWRG